MKNIDNIFICASIEFLSLRQSSSESVRPIWLRSDKAGVLGVYAGEATNRPRRGAGVTESFVPNLLRVSDFTYMSTWQGFVYAVPRHGHSEQWRSRGSIIDTFTDHIVGWRVSRSAKTDFGLAVIERALHDRRPVKKGGLIHHSDHGG